MKIPDLPASLGEDASRHVERTTMRAVASGSTTAFAQVYDLTSGHVFGFLLDLIPDQTAAEVLLQDTYVEVWQRAAAYAAHPGGLAPWICEIARRRIVGRFLETTPSRKLEDVAISDAIRSLPPAESECIALAYYAGLTQQEIAAHTAQPLSSVRRLTRTGLSQLHDRGEDAAPDPLSAVPA